MKKKNLIWEGIQIGVGLLIVYFIVTSIFSALNSIAHLTYLQGVSDGQKETWDACRSIYAR